MKFYKLSEIPTCIDDKVFKAMPLSQSIPIIIFFAIAIAALFTAVNGGIPKGKHINGLPPGSLYVVSAVFGLFGLFFVPILRASLKPTNWLFRCSSTAIIIKYRSCLHWRLPSEDIQTVAFDYSEIAWVRKVRQHQTSFGGMRGNSKRTEFKTFLEFCLKDPDTSVLEAHLETERKQKCNPHYWDYPVEVLSGGIIRIRRGGIMDYFFPNNDKAVQWLGQFIKIEPTHSSKVDFTGRSDIKPQNEDESILNLLKNGDKIGAVRLTQKIYGVSLTDAVEFVDKLQQK